jgi:hypothetical protein
VCGWDPASLVPRLLARLPSSDGEAVAGGGSGGGGGATAARAEDSAARLKGVAQRMRTLQVRVCDPVVCWRCEAPQSPLALGMGQIQPLCASHACTALWAASAVRGGGPSRQQR